MRSPWKILSDLAARKRVREEQEAVKIEHHAPDAASESEQSPKHLVSQPEQTWDDLVERDKSSVVATEKSEPETLPPVSPEPQVEIAEKPETNVVAKTDNDPKLPVLPKQSQNRTSSVVIAAPAKEQVAQTSKSAEKDQAPKAPSKSADPFLSELSQLDGEIQQLRVALARKLQLQNAQLRKMLDRFGPR